MQNSPNPNSKSFSRKFQTAKSKPNNTFSHAHHRRRRQRRWTTITNRAAFKNNNAPPRSRREGRRTDREETLPLFVMGGNFPLIETAFNVAASSALLFAGTSHAILQRPSILVRLSFIRSFYFVFSSMHVCVCVLIHKRIEKRLNNFSPSHNPNQLITCI